MTLLSRPHLHANAVLESGPFAAHRSSNSACGPDDQTNHEQGLQDKGGISLDRGAVQRLILTVHVRAKTLQTCREMTGLYDAESKQHKDASVPHIKKDEDVAHKVMNPLKSCDPNKPLLNIASGVKTTEVMTLQIIC